MKKRVLVVDDDLDFAETLGESFSMRGCDVDIAHSGEEAISLYRDGFYDVAFMDVKLPGKNGVESFVEIKKLRPKAHVVMMTGYAVQALLEEAKAEGVNAVFHKLVDMDGILNYVEKIKPRVAVLMVDDDLDFSDTTREILEDAGYEVAVAGDTRLALELLEQKNVDILLLDVRLKDSSALHLYQYMHHQEWEIPTIVVTGYSIEESHTINTLKALCVKEVLTKPLHPGVLLSVLERYTGGGRQG